MADVDLSTGDTFNKKIRNSQLAQYNYIIGELFACYLVSKRVDNFVLLF